MVPLGHRRTIEGPQQLRVIRKVGPRRVRVTADRGCADGALFAVLTELRVAFVTRAKKHTTVCIAGV
jgi:hypothetical protein